MLQTLSHLFQPNSFISLKVGKFVLGFDCKRLGSSSGKEKESRFLCVHVFRKTWTWAAFSRRSLAVMAKKKMYKKRDARAKLLFCQSKPISITFLPFMLSLMSSSSLLKLPIVYKRVCFVNGVNKTTTFFRLVDVFHKNVEIRRLVTSLLLQFTKNRDVEY